MKEMSVSEYTCSICCSLKDGHGLSCLVIDKLVEASKTHKQSTPQQHNKLKAELELMNQTLSTMRADDLSVVLQKNFPATFVERVCQMFENCQVWMYVMDVCYG